jgi:hypothetical protein
MPKIPEVPSHPSFIAANPPLAATEAGPRVGIAVTTGAPPALCLSLAISVLLLAFASLPCAGAYIDSFAVGPQSFSLAPGDASAQGVLSGLDTNQVAFGSRSFLVYAYEAGCGFRPLEGGAILLGVNGSTPGAFNVDIGESVAQGENPSDGPWIYLSYSQSGVSLDWSAFDRIVITFATPPTTDMLVQFTIAGDETWAVDTNVPAGTLAVTIPFSSLTAVPSSTFTGLNVTSCAFSFSPPRSELFSISDIQLVSSGAPPQPLLNVMPCKNGVALTWPTNGLSMVLQHSTSMTNGFDTITNVPVIAGTNYSVLLPCACPSEFFRLKSSP